MYMPTSYIFPSRCNTDHRVARIRVSILYGETSRLENLRLSGVAIGSHMWPCMLHRRLAVGVAIMYTLLGAVLLTMICPMSCAGNGVIKSEGGDTVENAVHH